MNDRENLWVPQSGQLLHTSFEGFNNNFSVSFIVLLYALFFKVEHRSFLIKRTCELNINDNTICMADGCISMNNSLWQMASIYIVSKGWVFGASINIINTKQHLLVKVLSIKLAPFTFPSPVPGTQLKLDITGQCF